MKKSPLHFLIFLFFVSYSLVWVTNHIIRIETSFQKNSIEQIEKDLEEKLIDEQSKIGLVRIFANSLVDLTIKTDVLKYNQLSAFSKKECFLKIVTPPPIA